MVERGIDHKANTTSSMFIKSTITSPNVKSIIQAVSTILHSQMLEVIQRKIIYLNFL